VDIEVKRKSSGLHSACAGYAHGVWDTTALAGAPFDGSPAMRRRRLAPSQAVKQPGILNSAIT